MFWRFGGYANISTLDNILDKADVTVEELLDESDLIQELKQQNSKLVEFLRDEPVLKKLLGYVVAEKTSDDVQEDSKEKSEKSETSKRSEDGNRSRSGIGFFRSSSKSTPKGEGSDAQTELEKKEEQRKKYSYVACEVLSSEVWSLTEAIVEQREHLREFWSYMYRPAPLDPLQAGYFTKVNEALLDKKTEEMLAFFKSLDGVVPAMLQHVDCPMVMDLLLKIISLEKHEGGAGIVDWLQQQGLIPLLLGFLSSEHSGATQTSAGDFLKAIITISANATTQDQSVIGPNELTRQLVSVVCIEQLIDNMLKGGNPLTVGVGIIIEVIRKNNSDYDIDSQIGPEPKTSDPIYLGTLLRQFADKVPEFMNLIRAPSARKQAMKTAFGGRVEPLGFDRFKTCELMAELLHCSNMSLLNERGAEGDVRKRDAERQRLKAEGKLATPRPPASISGGDNSHDEFGSSVDSHGFHHAQPPSTDEEPEQIQRAEIQGEEDGFERVEASKISDDLPDEVTFDDFNEKTEETSPEPLQKVPKLDPSISGPDAEFADMPKPLSPLKPLNKPMLHFDPPPSAPVANSPTSAGLTDRLNTTSLDEDTVMTEFGEEQMSPADEDGPSELERELAKAERPPPLFASKKPLQPEDSTADEQPLAQSVTTIHADEPSQTTSNGERSAFETESDGSAVVGDYLKIQFVEHHVVPTILDFFFRFPWNNFLHNVVYDVVQQVFNGTLERGYNRTLAFDLYASIPVPEGQTMESMGFSSLKDITDRILDGQKASDESQQSPKGMRLGYMGHLTLIAEEVCKFGNRNGVDGLDQEVLDRINRPEWTQYVEGTLTETREKDNAVLGGVRPEHAMGVRQLGISGLGGGFTSNTASTLANAGIGAAITPQDSLAMSEGTVGQSFDINAGSSGFGDGDDDDMDEDNADREGDRRGSAGSAFSDEEQATSSPTAAQPSIPPPLNVPPSRARKQLAARLAQRKKEAEAANTYDPDTADRAAVETANRLSEEPPSIDLDAVRPAGTGINQTDEEDPGIEVAGMGSLRPGASRFSGLFSSSDSDSDESSGFDEDEAGRDSTLYRAGGDFEDESQNSSSAARPPRPRVLRRESTREAKERQPLSDDEDEDETATTGLASTMSGLKSIDDDDEDYRERSPFADPDDDDDSSDDAVEIRQPRRIS